MAGRIRRHMEDCCRFVPFFWGASSERSGGAAPALTPVQSHRVELSEHFACESPSPIVLVLVLLLFCLFCYQIAVFRKLLSQPVSAFCPSLTGCSRLNFQMGLN